LRAHFYHKSLPKELGRCEVILIDPMLATGGSAVAALDFLREQGGAKKIRLVSLVAAPEGIARVRKSHATLPIFTAAVDRQLNNVGYILPGLGDAGDRLFGT
jgi:uracil phosphoribosyltransferase